MPIEILDINTRGIIFLREMSVHEIFINNITKNMSKTYSCKTKENKNNNLFTGKKVKRKHCYYVQDRIKKPS